MRQLYHADIRSQRAGVREFVRPVTTYSNTSYELRVYEYINRRMYSNNVTGTLGVSGVTLSSSGGRRDRQAGISKLFCIIFAFLHEVVWDGDGNWL
jgi:hypothetical protein